MPVGWPRSGVIEASPSRRPLLLRAEDPFIHSSSAHGPSDGLTDLGGHDVGVRVESRGASTVITRYPQCLRQSPHMVDPDDDAERPDDHRGHPDLWHVSSTSAECRLTPVRRTPRRRDTRRQGHRQQPLLKSGIDRLRPNAFSAPDVAEMRLITSPTVASTIVRITGH